jgi:hypothetical protein
MRDAPGWFVRIFDLVPPDPTPAPPPHLADHVMHSKEDEDILKAEYLKNPKPDKAARLDIITKVALGEKEVQV